MASARPAAELFFGEALERIAANGVTAWRKIADHDPSQGLGAVKAQPHVGPFRWAPVGTAVLPLIDEFPTFDLQRN
jgi:hypothetical protein